MAWVPAPVSRVAELMRPFDRTWFLVGGWAVDAWLGRQSRDHIDVDLAIFREDESALFDHLPGWHLVGHDTSDATHDEPWDGKPLGFPAHIHGRYPEWPALDVQVNQRSVVQWILSRAPPLAVALDEVVQTSPWGVPTLVPELVIWHKARDEPRPHDERDFAALLPMLDATQRGWLIRSIGLLDANHPWLQRLKASD